MAITLTRRRHQPPKSKTADVPPVLPVVVMTVQPDATLHVVVDGDPFSPPSFAPPWQRQSVAQILSEVVELCHSPMRVVVHELDGTVYTRTL